MTTFVYIHGFNSAFTVENPKVPVLETLGPVFGFTYDTLQTRDQIIRDLVCQMNDFLAGRNHDDFCFVGTSLGGYFAAELGKLFGYPSVVINPSIEPAVTLKRYVDHAHTNFVTGITKVYEKAAADSFVGHKLQLGGRFKPLVLLDKDDELIPAMVTLGFVMEKAPVHVFEGGSHRFDHMDESLPIIAAYLNTVEVL